MASVKPPYAMGAPQSLGNPAMPEMINRTGGPNPKPVTQPMTGLMGYEDALMRGVGAGVTSLDQGRMAAIDELMRGYSEGSALDESLTREGLGALQGGYGESVNLLSGYADPRAHQLQMALSGALGAGAQAQAYQDFQNSPGQAYLVEEGEKALLRNASATGGLGGGRVKKELLRHAIGMAAQDIDRSFARLGTVADRGFGAAGETANLLVGQGRDTADIMSNLGMRTGTGRMDVSRDIASVQDNAGVNAANIFVDTGKVLGETRNQTGRDLANAIGSTTSALADLQATQGAGMSDILGADGANIANLLSGYGQLTAAQKQQLAAILANIATGSGTQLANLEGQIGQAKADGIIGKAGAVKDTVSTVAKIAAGMG